jgi:hypothetical protein
VTAPLAASLDDGFRIIFATAASGSPSRRRRRCGAPAASISRWSRWRRPISTRRRSSRHSSTCGSTGPTSTCRRTTTRRTRGLWRAIELIAEALANENPDLVVASRAYREPVCFNTAFNIRRNR